MGERPRLAGVHEVQWPPVAARPAPSTPGQVNVIPHHPCIVAFLLNRRQSSDPAKIYAAHRYGQGGTERRDMIFNNGECGECRGYRAFPSKITKTNGTFSAEFPLDYV